MPFIARTPEPPYYAVIFTSINAEVDHTSIRRHIGVWSRSLKAITGFWVSSPPEMPMGQG